MEIICINDVFSPDQLQVWAKYNVVHPTKDKIYTIRDVIRNSTGKTGLLLEEIKNSKIPIVHPVMKTEVWMEPNWCLTRFSSLTGNTLRVEEILQNIKQNVSINK